MTALLQLLSRLPGVGEKMAERIATGIAGQKQDYKVALARAIEGHGSPVPCIVCGDDGGPEACARCTAETVDRSMLLVVKGPKDRDKVETTRVWPGAYHVLRGLIDMGSGVGPAQLRVRGLLERLRGDTVSEVVFALGGTTRALETTDYLRKLMPPGLKVSTICVGLGVGDSLEYADAETIAVAVRDRFTVRG